MQLHWLTESINVALMSQQSFGDIRNRQQERHQAVATGKSEGDSSYHRGEFRLLQSTIHARRSDTAFWYVHTISHIYNILSILSIY